MQKESIVFDTENKRVLFYKDCQKCIHLQMCKFREAQEDLMKSKLMKEISNSYEISMDGFDLHTKCKFFVHKLTQVTKDSATVLNTTFHSITERIVDVFVHEKIYPQVKYENNLDYDTVLRRDSFSYQNNHTLVTIKVFNDKFPNETLFVKQFELEHILNDWTYLDLSNNLISG